MRTHVMKVYTLYFNKEEYRVFNKITDILDYSTFEIEDEMIVVVNGHKVLEDIILLLKSAANQQEYLEHNCEAAENIRYIMYTISEIL